MLRSGLTLPSRALRSSTRTIGSRHLFRIQTLPTPITAHRSQSAVLRWYSEALNGSAMIEEESEVTKPVAESPKATESTEDPLVAELKEKLESKEKEAVNWKDKCLRTIADFRNLQDRTQRDIKSSRDYAIQAFAKDLLDSIDNLDRALETVPQEKLQIAKDERSEDLQDLVNLYDGLKMTDDILQNTLRRHGIERFDPLGEKFNPNDQEAVSQLKMPDKEDNTVFFVQQKGFKLNGRVLRAAKVGVVRNN